MYNYFYNIKQLIINNEILIELFLTVVTIFVSITALYCTSKQIKLNNKHAIFSKRMEVYELLSCALSSYNEMKKIIKEDFYKVDTKFYSSIDTLFITLTDNNYFNDIKLFIENKKIIDNDKRDKFYKCIREAKLKIQEIVLLYDKGESEYSCIIDFLTNYITLIDELYTISTIKIGFCDFKNKDFYKATSKNKNKILELINKLNDIDDKKLNEQIEKMKKEINFFN